MPELKNWLVHRIADAALEKMLAAHAKGVLLDVGCGTKPYVRFTKGRTTRHVGLDHPGSLHGDSAVDVAGWAPALPFKAEAFDSLLCTAVLEHLEEPQQALNEAYRVLKPGGIAMYLAPFIWHVHEEPRDFFRYSRYGLEYLFHKAGFEVVELKALSGFWVTFGQLLVYNLYRFQRGPMKWIPIIPLLGWGIQWCALGLDKIDRSERWTWAYLIAGRKPV